MQPCSNDDAAVRCNLSMHYIIYIGYCVYVY